LPNPAAVAGPTYLYGILALTSGFLGGLPIWIGAGMTIALIWQSQKTPVQPATKPSTPQSQVANQNSKNTTAYPGPTSAVGSSRKTG
jgi:H+/gluconate symporter-like permease